MIPQKEPLTKVLHICARMIFMTDNRHVSYFKDKHTFQEQKPAARLSTVLVIEFQSWPFFNFEGSHG